MRKIALGLLLLALTACGASPTTGSDTTGSANTSPAASIAPATSTAPEASPSTEASPAASGPTGALAPRDADQLTQHAMAFLATQLNKPTEALRLLNKEEVEWNNSGLGCEQKGMMYAQMIVPGYKLTYSDGSQTYEIHTDQSGEQLVWCDNGTPKEIGQP